MRFSIIVPIYNVELYLSECLESILNQTCQDYEIVCINDASTDGSYDILKRYAEKNDKIRVFTNDSNQGLSYSRNRGVDEARGDYILFVDSDDMLELEALKILNDVIMKDDVDIVHYRLKIKNEGKMAKEQNALPEEQTMFNENIQTGQSLFVEMAQNNDFSITACSQLYKREFLTGHGLRFYEGILHEDVLHTFECTLVASKVKYIHKYLYTYRRRDQSITSTVTERRLDSFIIIIGAILERWRTYSLENGMDDAIRKYIERYIPLMDKMCALFPKHNRLEIGTPADQFLFEIFKGTRKQRFRYVHLEELEIQQIRKHEKIIVYGAGGVAAELISCLEDYGIAIEAVAVSDKTINQAQISGIQIYQIEELRHLRMKALVIIGVMKRNQSVIVQKLQKLGFDNVLCIDTDKGAAFYMADK